MTTTLIQSVLSFLSALAGAGLVFKMKLTHDKLCALISLSAGALAGAAILILIPESLGAIKIYEAILAVISGYVLFWVINKYYFHICPACSASHFDETTTKKFSEIVMLLFTALSFHSFLDGLAISAGGVDKNAVFSAIFAHKFPEGIALASLMAGANYKKYKIFEFVFLVEITTIVGTIVGNFAHFQANSWILGIIQGHISGGFFFLAMHAVMGEIFHHHKKLVILSFLSGFLFIFVVSKIAF
jgi:ZIP family zinc transporter/zinc and cadmium transporter